MKNFKIANRTFSYPVEEGVIVMKLKKNNYFIHFSTFIAKTLLEWEHLIDLPIFLKEYGLPLKFIEKYLWVPQYPPRMNNPEGRVFKNQSIDAFITSIYLNYCERYGAENVKSSKHLFYGEVAMEHKSQWIDDKLNVFPYEELVGFKNGTARNTQ